MSKVFLACLLFVAIMGVESRRGGGSSRSSASSSHGKQGNVQAVWQTAERGRGLNPATHRVDASGTVIHRNRYGQTGSGGWEIDHIQPHSKGGSDNIHNLQALNTHDNRAYGNRVDDRLTGGYLHHIHRRFPSPFQFYAPQTKILENETAHVGNNISEK